MERDSSFVPRNSAFSTVWGISAQKPHLILKKRTKNNLFNRTEDS